MKINKNLIILSLLLIFCISLGVVSAADSTDIGVNDINNIDVNSADVQTSASFNNDINNLRLDEYKTFKELNETIDNCTSEEINLDHDYKYDKDIDSDFINGININKIITINGNGHIIDGSNMGRAFNIASNNVIIKNLNFVNCNSSGSGGAISGGVNCSVVNCSFVNCFASGYGGGAISGGVNCSVVNCSFVNCSGKGYGGAIFCGGVNYSVVGCSFVNCSGSGGAIYSNTVNISVINCSFVNCNSSGSGGAIYLSGANSSVMNCSFVNCSGSNSGAISFAGANSSVVNCSFVNSHSDNAEGGAISFWESNGSVVGCSFVNCSISWLSNSSYGGAIYFGSGGVADNCSFVGCNASYGGAIYLGGANGTLRNCSFVNCSGYRGGAIFIKVSNCVVVNCSFVGCNATSAGAGAIYSLGKDTIVDYCSFVNCSAGGAIYLSGANGVVGNCSFVNCSTNYYGGAIYLSDANSYVGNCSFVNCSATSAGAGAIYSLGKDTIVDYCSFVNCSGYKGGAIYWKGDNGSVNYCSFVSCSAMENGGAINSDTYGSVVNCSFMSCRARYGGAISHDGGDGIINVNGCIFTLCNATEGKIIYDTSINGINWDGNFFTTNNTITADEFIANGFGYKEGKGNITPNYWVVLKIKFTIDGYVLEFVKNGTNNVVKMPDYKVKVILNDRSSIVSVGEEQFTKFYNESIDVYSLEGIFLDSFYYYYDSFSNLAREIYNCKDDKFVLTHNYKFYENYDNPVRDGIIIDKPIIIEGNGYIIDGFNKSSVFKITSNNVIIKNLNFVNCDFSSYSGVIDLGGVNCSVVNCSFVNSSGSGDASECGAIFCGGVNCSVVNCSFVNSYGSGGAIYWNGTNGVVGNCSFVDSYGSGGAIYCLGANCSVSGCSFVNCSTNAGGAIYCLGANCSVSGCSFVNCSTNVGGAIYCGGANCSVSGCSFVNCRAILDGGGAIYWYPHIKSGVVGNCSFVNCSANTYGGAIYSYDVKDIVSCSFVNCSANKEGGAIECIKSDSEVVNCSFVGCNAENGGAMSGIYRYVNACIFENNKASSLGNALCLYGDLNVGDNFFVTNNTITSRDFIAKKFIYSYNDGKYVAPNNWVVLNISNSGGYYVVNFVLNDGSILDESISDYGAIFSENGEIRDIVVKDNVWSGPIYKSGDVTACVNSPVTGALLASLELEVPFKEVEIILPEDPVFVVGAGDNYTVVIKSDGEAIGADYVVVLELVNGGNRKNYTLTTDENGSVSLPINLGYAKVYTFNIYFNPQDNYLGSFASQDITVNAIVTKLVTAYTDDWFNSTVFSYDDWTATLLDVNDNPISNVIVNVNFTGLNNKTVVYKIKSDSNGDVKLSLRLGFVGLYKISANFEGNSHYKSSSSNNISININKTNVTIIAKNITTTNKSGENYTIQLLTTNDKAISGAKVYINFTNKNGVGTVYKLKTDASGKAFLPLNLAYVGNYNLVIFFNDTENYNGKVTKTTQVKVVKDEQVLAKIEE